MNDFLQDIFEKQKMLNKRIEIEDTNMLALMTSSNVRDREKVSQHFVLAMHAELSELLEWTNWKMWKKKRVEYTDEQLKELRIELIDLLHFWVNLCLIWGLTPSMIKDMFKNKNEENHNRQDGGY